jgi:hypothetical protein
MSKKKKWNRKLGTSKREQGIITPKAPQNRGKRKEEARSEPIIAPSTIPGYLKLWRYIMGKS